MLPDRPASSPLLMPLHRFRVRERHRATSLTLELLPASLACKWPRAGKQGSGLKERVPGSLGADARRIAGEGQAGRLRRSRAAIVHAPPCDARRCRSASLRAGPPSVFAAAATCWGRGTPRRIDAREGPVVTFFPALFSNRRADSCAATSAHASRSRWSMNSCAQWFLRVGDEPGARGVRGGAPSRGPAGSVRCPRWGGSLLGAQSFGKTHLVRAMEDNTREDRRRPATADRGTAGR